MNWQKIYAKSNQISISIFLIENSAILLELSFCYNFSQSIYIVNLKYQYFNIEYIEFFAVSL